MRSLLRRLALCLIALCIGVPQATAAPTFAYHAYARQVTPSIELVGYLANPTRYNLALVYVSSVSANGIPVGSDAVGNGTIGNPFLTCAVGIASLSRPGEVRFNGTSQASPTTYTCASSTLTTAITISSAVAGQRIATLAGSGAVAAFSAAPTTGQPIAFTDLNIDPSLNVGGGPGASCFSLSSQSTSYAFTATNVKCTNWTTHGLYAPSAAFKGDVTVTSGTFNGGAVSTAINLPAQSAGSLTVNGTTTVTITAQTAGGASLGGAVNQQATASGVTAYVKVSFTITLDPALGGGFTHQGVYLKNVVAMIDGGTHSMISATRACYISGTSQTVASPFPISNSIIQNVTASHDCASGGIVIFTATDTTGFTRSNAQNVIVQGNAISTTEVNSSTHGYFLAGGEDQILRNNTATSMGLCAVIKYSTRPQVYGNNMTACSSSYSLWKDAQNVDQHDNIWTATASHAGRLQSVTRDSATLVTSSGTATGDTYINNGGASVPFLVVEDTSTFTSVGNTWTLSAGTMNTHPWTVQGVNYDLFNGGGGWQAVYGPTDTSNVPLRRPANDNRRPAVVRRRRLPERIAA